MKSNISENPLRYLKNIIYLSADCVYMLYRNIYCLKRTKSITIYMSTVLSTLNKNMCYDIYHGFVVLNNT